MSEDMPAEFTNRSLQETLLHERIAEAWEKARVTPGFLGEDEARFLGLMAAAAPAGGEIVEIGSFKGRSTVMLATIARAFQLGKVTAIDPHTAPSATDPGEARGGSTFEEFLQSLRAAGAEEHVDVRRAFSRDVAKNWSGPIRLLWIDGDHTYAGAKLDFEGFAPFLAEGALLAFHDALNAFDGPIRVFVEDVLRSDRFGPAGFVQSIAWAQFRPRDGAQFTQAREALARRAARLIPYVQDGRPLTGWRKKMYKLWRSRVPRKLMSSSDWLAAVEMNNGK